MQNKAPVGSTLVSKTKRGKRYGGRNKGNGKKLNMIATTDLVSSDTIVGAGDSGAAATGSIATDTPQTTKGTVAAVDPPYSYKDTDAAPCDKLADMIATVKTTMTYVRLDAAGAKAYNDWLTYATNRYNTYCNIKQAPVVVTDSGVTVDNPPTPITDPLTPVEINVTPGSDIPHPIETMQGPTVTPFDTSNAGGGGGGATGSDSASPDSRKNYALIAGLAIFTIGCLIFSKA